MLFRSVVRHSPQFGPAIRQARQQLRADPKCRVLLEQAAEMARRAPVRVRAPEGDDEMLSDAHRETDSDSAPRFSAYLEMAH